MTMSTHEPGGAATGRAQSKGLQAGAVNALSSFMISVASVGPALVLTAILGVAISIAGPQAAGIMLIAALPIFGIILAYGEMNRESQDCGTTFVWVTRALGPTWGFMSAWGLVGACLLVMPASAFIVTVYAFSLFGLAAETANPAIFLAVGLAFLLFITWVCYVRVEVAATVQKTLVVIEMLLVFVLLGAMIFHIAAGNTMEGAATPSLDWLNPLGASSFVSAFIVAVFGYWGWDIAFSLNEETDGDAGTPTRSAISTLFSLVILYVISVVVFVAYAGEAFISENSELLLDALGGNVLGVIGAKLLVILVLTSGVAATQATIIPATRTLLSMGAFGAMPKRFGRVNRFETPGFATIVYGVISALVFVALTAISVDVLFDSLSSTGMLICFYYGLSGVGCAWYFRDTLTKSVRNLIIRGIFPFLSGALMLVIFVIKAFDDFNNSVSTIFGMGAVFVFAVGFLLVGIIIMLLSRRSSNAFYSGESI
jgi:amino acid transporter